MKSPMSQIVMITLAIVFATALTVTVTLLCISYIEKNPTAYAASRTLPSYTTQKEPFTVREEETSTLFFPISTDTDAFSSSSSDSSEEEPIPEKPSYPGSTLAFASNGNGTCTLIGIGDCKDVCISIPEYSPVGDRVIAIAPRAFYGCASLTAIQIPAGVALIGNMAFAACENLVYISVNDANPYYCDIDGVLYTADLYTLLFYPPMHAGEHLTVSAVTAEIMEMAFYNCAYLTHVTYEGSAEEWDTIEIGAKNHSLTAASKSFLKK